MNFRLINTLAGIVGIPFGLGFLLMPEMMGEIYGVTGWNPGTVAVGRLYGVMFLFVAIISFSVRDFSDHVVQTKLARAFFVYCLLAGGMCAFAAITGAMNPFIWSGVAILCFFWCRLGTNESSLNPHGSRHYRRQCRFRDLLKRRADQSFKKQNGQGG